MRFKHLIAATCLGSVLIGTASMAADLPARPLPPIMPAFTWTGFYSGIALGGVSGDFRDTTLNTPGFTDATGTFPAAAIPFSNAGFVGLGRRSVEKSSALVATRGGYLHQFGALVLGIETDTQLYSVTGRRAPLTAAPVGFPDPFVLGSDYSLHSGSQSSVRGRIGFAWDRFQIYGTGGVSFARVKATSSIPATFFVGGPTFANGLYNSKDKTITGWTGGVGGEWAITDATSIGVEYRHSEYERESILAGAIGRPGVPGGSVPITARVDYSNDVVMFTYNVRFGKIFPVFDWHL